MGNEVNIVKKSYLKFISYADVLLWDVKRYTSDTKRIFNYSTQLKDVLLPFKESISKNKLIENDYKIISKINFGGKLFLRGVEDIETYKGNLFLVPENSIIYSKINIRHGCIYHHSENEVPFSVSSEYPVFTFDKKVVNGCFLTLMLRGNNFKRILNSKTSGISKARVKVDEFLNIGIPLPSIGNQYNMVDSYNKKIQLALQKEQQVNKLEKNVDNYLLDTLGIKKNKDKKIIRGLQIIKYSNLSKWSVDFLLKENFLNIEDGKYKTLSFKEVITFFEGGKTPSKSKSYFWNGNVSWTSPKDFNGIFIEKSQDHITDIAVQEAGMKVFPVGVFLSVFRSGILRHSFPTAITKIETAINQDLKAYAVNEKIINKYYFLYFIHTFKNMILKRASKKSVTVESINTEDFMEILIPVPPMKIQNEIVSTIEKMKAEIKLLQQQAEENRKSAIEEFEQAIF